MPRNILVIGCRGQVGWELMRTLQPFGRVTGVDYPDLDLTRPDSVRAWLDQTHPDVVVNAAAYTAVDRAETEPELARCLNATAPALLAEETCRRGAWLVHYSTDYVFDGHQEAPYGEDAPPNPLSEYGRSKLAGDLAVQQAGGRYLIFRLCWVYGGRGQNFLRTMLRLFTTREEVRVVNDQWGAPTWSRHIAETTALVLARVLHAPEPMAHCGVYHLTASGVTTWHGFARAIWERVPASVRRCREVVPITTAEYPTPARRPMRAVLDCAKLERVFGLRLPHWETGLRQVLESPVEGFEQLRFLL